MRLTGLTRLTISARERVGCLLLKAVAKLTTLRALQLPFLEDWDAVEVVTLSPLSALRWDEVERPAAISFNLGLASILCLFLSQAAGHIEQLCSLRRVSARWPTR